MGELEGTRCCNPRFLLSGVLLNLIFTIGSAGGAGNTVSGVWGWARVCSSEREHWKAPKRCWGRSYGIQKSKEDWILVTGLSRPPSGESSYMCCRCTKPRSEVERDSERLLQLWPWEYACVSVEHRGSRVRPGNYRDRTGLQWPTEKAGG